ncbi:uncharacterized protein LOC111639950 isoform X2 [Centruroides sculpturatus]|uniref:uncharacterized protein LOC111639950 isoform X2 n=1 Tax=Centruroides sculpturatus TaxID=218467 RepID=UPI000C6DE8FE|nr:uncharacterized protein LOC111639950 isoform X2 [Centruroides sculpturatus]
MSILVLLPFLFYFSFCGENVVSGFSFYATTPAREGDLLFPASNEWQESRGRPFSIREPSRPPLRRTTKGFAAGGPCPPGFRSHRRLCQACPPGEFSEFEESRKCFPCPPDTYAPKYASTRCIPCPPGSGTWSQSSTALRSCRGGLVVWLAESRLRPSNPRQKILTFFSLALSLLLFLVAAATLLWGRRRTDGGAFWRRGKRYRDRATSKGKTVLDYGRYLAHRGSGTKPTDDDGIRSAEKKEKKKIWRKLKERAEREWPRQKATVDLN